MFSWFCGPFRIWFVKSKIVIANGFSRKSLADIAAGIVAKCRDITVIERVRTLVCLPTRADRASATAINNIVVRRGSRKSVRFSRMVNRGTRMVNCRLRVTKHERLYFLWYRTHRSTSLAKESRVKSYMQIISSSSFPDLLVARVIGDVRGTCASCIYIVYVCYGIVSVQVGTSAYIIVLEGERMYIRLPAVYALFLPLFLSADFNAGKRRRCANVKGGMPRGRKENALSRG